MYLNLRHLFLFSKGCDQKCQSGFFELSSCNHTHQAVCKSKLENFSFVLTIMLKFRKVSTSAWMPSFECTRRFVWTSSKCYIYCSAELLLFCFLTWREVLSRLGLLCGGQLWFVVRAGLSKAAFTRHTIVGKLVLTNSSWCVWTAQKQSTTTLANNWVQTELISDM